MSLIHLSTDGDGGSSCLTLCDLRRAMTNAESSVLVSQVVRAVCLRYFWNCCETGNDTLIICSPLILGVEIRMDSYSFGQNCH